MAAGQLSCASDEADDDGKQGAADAAPQPADAGMSRPDTAAPTADAAEPAAPDARDALAEAQNTLRTRLQEALGRAPAGVDGMALIVHDAQDARVLDMTIGSFRADQRVPVASASKLVTGLVLLRAVQAGDLSLSSTPRDVLGWTDSQAADATLDHLGAFVSGLPANHLCTARLGITLQACAEDLSQAPTEASPGARYDYGSTHQAVAGAMAEAATGQSWAALFEGLKQDLGLDAPDLRYVTYPKQALGGSNPLLAGGLLATANEYMPLLALAFHEGRAGGRTIINADLIARMRRNPYAEATIGVSPAQTIGLDFRYGFSAWLNCPGAVASCPVISSPGRFGFTPWIDWDAGYYAVLAMESEGQGGAVFSMPLAEDIRPLIEDVLAQQR